MNNNTSNNELRNNIISLSPPALTPSVLRRKMARKTSSTRKMLWKHCGDGTSGGSERQARYTKAENPSRLNNVGNLPAECGNKQWRTPLLYTSSHDAGESAERGMGRSTYRGCCIALLLFGTHITSGITIFPLCVAFALDFFHFLHEKKAAERKRGRKKVVEMRKSAIMMCIWKNDERGRGGRTSIKARLGGVRSDEEKRQKTTEIEIVVVLILKPFQFQSHLWILWIVQMRCFMEGSCRRDKWGEGRWLYGCERKTRKINSSELYFFVFRLSGYIEYLKIASCSAFKSPSVAAARLDVDTCQAMIFSHPLFLFSLLNPSST